MCEAIFRAFFSLLTVRFGFGERVSGQGANFRAGNPAVSLGVAKMAPALAVG